MASGVDKDYDTLLYLANHFMQPKTPESQSSPRQAIQCLEACLKLRLSAVKEIKVRNYVAYIYLYYSTEYERAQAHLQRAHLLLNESSSKTLKQKYGIVFSWCEALTAQGKSALARSIVNRTLKAAKKELLGYTNLSEQPYQWLLALYLQAGKYASLERDYKNALIIFDQAHQFAVQKQMPYYVVMALLGSAHIQILRWESQKAQTLIIQAYAVLDKYEDCKDDTLWFQLLRVYAGILDLLNRMESDVIREKDAKKLDLKKSLQSLHQITEVVHQSTTGRLYASTPQPFIMWMAPKQISVIVYIITSTCFVALGDTKEAERYARFALERITNMRMENEVSQSQEKFYLAQNISLSHEIVCHEFIISSCLLSAKYNEALKHIRILIRLHGSNKIKQNGESNSNNNNSSSSNSSSSSSSTIESNNNSNDKNNEGSNNNNNNGNANDNEIESLIHILIAQYAYVTGNTNLSVSHYQKAKLLTEKESSQMIIDMSLLLCLISMGPPYEKAQAFAEEMKVSSSCLNSVLFEVVDHYVASLFEVFLYENYSLSQGRLAEAFSTALPRKMNRLAAQILLALSQIEIKLNGLNDASVRYIAEARKLATRINDTVVLIIDLDKLQGKESTLENQLLERELDTLKTNRHHHEILKWKIDS